MGIWNLPFSLEQLNRISTNNMAAHLGILFTEIGPDYITASMPIDYRTKQPAGLLHGGASLVLAETLGSVGAWMCIDQTKQQCVGMEINANHIRSVREGTVFGTASPIHIGKTTQVWGVKITTEKNQLVCTSRITLAVLDKKN